MAAKKSKVWLSHYMSKAKSLGLEASFPGMFDFLEFYELDEKIKAKTITPEERRRFDVINKESLEIINHFKDFQYFPPENMPNKLYWWAYEKIKPTDKVFTITNGFLVVNKEISDVLKKHRLGKTHMSEVHIYDIRNMKLVTASPYYLLNIAEHRHTYLPELSKEFDKCSYQKDGHDIYMLSYYAGEKYCSVSEKALSMDIDLWHDPYLTNSVFMSDQLFSALKEIGCTKRTFALRECKVITDK